MSATDYCRKYLLLTPAISSDRTTNKALLRCADDPIVVNRKHIQRLTRVRGLQVKAVLSLPQVEVDGS